jgi:predicted RNA binding protein YcfA (HicA-like mRNA interferase family)
MGKFPGVNHQRAIRALERAGFEIIREGPHVTMWNGAQMLTIPRNNPIDAYTMFGIIRDAGLTVEQFRKLL